MAIYMYVSLRTQNSYKIHYNIICTPYTMIYQIIYIYPIQSTQVTKTHVIYIG